MAPFVAMDTPEACRDFIILGVTLTINNGNALLPFGRLGSLMLQKPFGIIELNSLMLVIVSVAG